MLPHPHLRPQSPFPFGLRLVNAVLSLGLVLAGPGAGLAPYRSPRRAGGPAISAEQAIALTLQAEVGANDFRLSTMGDDTLYDARAPAVAYNSQNDEYLVVWRGDDNSGGLVDEEYEIFGQRLNAATGAELGGDFRLSDMGPDGSTSYNAFDPAVAYNSQNDEYLVVWWGDDNSGGLVDDEYEIFGQRLNAATGAELGGDFRLSDMGP
ncbi:MAG: hypothetical protein IT317_17430, partial [Anaerolineales bacterium]|nr:hypothetical protein [Anaerolineales bacterium]